MLPDYADQPTRAEEHVSIIVACVPTLKPLFDRVCTRIASHRMPSITREGESPLKQLPLNKRHPPSEELELSCESSEQVHDNRDSFEKPLYTV